MIDLTAVNEWTRRAWDATADTDLASHQTPLNQAAIRAQVLDAYAAGRTVGPVTPEYLAVPADLLVRLDVLVADLATAEGDLVDMVGESVRATAGFAHALADRSPDAITGHGARQYGLPDTGLIAAAEQILSADAQQDSDDASDPPVDLPTILQLIENVLQSLGVDGWTVDVREHMSARLSVSAQAREVRIRADVQLTAGQLRGLVVHEVGTHVLRSVNGSAQPLLMMARGLPGYLETEEGLATHHEMQVAPAPDRLRTFALRVVAAEAALQGGLAEVMSRVTAYVPPGVAFPIAMRAKRGLADLDQPGSPLKDMVYLRGLLAVGAHLAAEPEDAALLMAGKVGLHHLELLRTLRGDRLLEMPDDRVGTLIDQAQQARPSWAP